MVRANVALFLEVCLLPMATMALAGPTQKWAFTAKTNLSTTSQFEVVVSHDGSTVFVPASSDHIVAVDAQTGAQKWEYSQPSGYALNPALVSLDNSLLFAIPHYPHGAEAAEIVAISTSTGQLVRSFSQPGSSNVKPAFSPDGKTLYVSQYGRDDHVVAYDIATGAKKWGWKNADYIGACDVTVGPAGNIYVASYGHFALDSSGNQLWGTQSYQTGGAYCGTREGLGTRAAVTSTSTSTLFLAPNNLGTNYGTLYAMNAKTGEVQYSIEPAPKQDVVGINTLPSASYQHFFGVYPVGTYMPAKVFRLFVGDKSTGNEMASFKFPDTTIWTNPCPYLSASGDTVFVAVDTRVYAMTTSAKVLWTFDLDVKTHSNHRIKASPTAAVVYVTDGPTLRAISY